VEAMFSFLFRHGEISQFGREKMKIRKKNCNFEGLFSPFSNRKLIRLATSRHFLLALFFFRCVEKNWGKISPHSRDFCIV
jgi:hypothetical protein